MAAVQMHQYFPLQAFMVSVSVYEPPFAISIQSVPNKAIVLFEFFVCYDPVFFEIYTNIYHKHEFIFRIPFILLEIDYFV